MEFLNKLFSNIRIIGKGITGIVYFGISKTTNEPRAIKEISYKKSGKYRDKIINEINILMKLSSTSCINNISKLYDFYEDKEYKKMYIIMEYIDGINIYEYVNKFDTKQKPYISLFLFKQMNDILFNIHSQNILHLDIKHNNIMITKNNIIKIIDFGSSHITQSDVYLHKSYNSKNHCIQCLGTLSFLAPETYLYRSNYDQTDTWLLGSTFYYIITNKHIWGDDISIYKDHNLYTKCLKSNIPKLNSGFKLLDNVVNRCLVKDISTRITSAEIKDILKDFNIQLDTLILK